MWDIHAHILPGLDDGPRNLGESLATLRALAHEGVTHIVATPHFNSHYPRIPATEVQARVDELQQTAYAYGLPVALFAGHEIHLDADVEPALMQRRASMIHNGPYFLLELPSQSFPVFLPSLIGQFRLAGLIPVLAHVERYRPTHENVDVLLPLLEAGALLQVTASSLVGQFGPAVRQTAETLLRRDLVHVLASDVHAITDRPARFAEGARAAESLVGTERVLELTDDVPQAIVRGLPVRVSAPVMEEVRRHHKFWPLNSRSR